jgi:hypothetical protein
MPISQLPQAPYRQDRKIFPTPLVTDILFSEVRDCNRTEFPEYGTPHPNAAKWPHHKLIFIKSVDIERDGLFEFFYAADRENQDEYNFSYGYRNVIGNVGGREFRVVLREYIIPRSEFDPLYPAFQAPMPNVPEGLFEDIEYVFFDKTQKKIDQPELDSLYVAEVRTYIETAFLDYKLSYSVQVPDLVPEKFRSNIPQVVTEGIEAGLAAIPELEAGQLLASEDQLNPDIKVVKSVQQAKPTEDITLSGSRSYVETTKAITEETYSLAELEAETGLLIAQSIATPLGDGTFVRETVRVEEWPELISTEWDETINAQVVSKEQFVSPASVDTAAAHTSYRAVNKDRSLRTVQTPPDDALLNYKLEFPNRMDIRLPPVLKSISVVWSSEYGQGASDGSWNAEGGGTSGSWGGSESDSAESSGTIKPELAINIEESWGSDTSVTVYAFFIQTNNGSVSKEELNARIMSVVGPTEPWPVFKPVGHVIIARGGKASVRAGASVSLGETISENWTVAETGRTVAQSYDVGLNISVVNIPPTIHKQINIADNSRSLTVSTTCSTDIGGSISGEQIGEFTPKPIFKGYNASSTAAHGLSASVSPNVLLATTPDSIPTKGLYVLRTTIEPYKWGWAKCSAIVLDAANLT